MIDEILKEIKECEEQAEQLQKEAYIQGKDIVLRAETEAERQKKATIAECKADLKEAQIKAEKKALERRTKILADGERDAAILVESKKAVIDAVSDKIVKMMIEKY